MGFNVQIVIVYRDWLSISRSRHDQHNKFRFQLTFEEWLFYREANHELDIRNLISTYGSQFDLDNIHVIDYNGVAASDKDLFEVLVHEVIGNRSAVINSMKKVNVSPSNLLRQQMDIILERYMLSNHFCQYPSVIFAGGRAWANLTIPYTKLNINRLQEYSDYIDEMFRITYTGKVHLSYGNSTATTSMVIEPLKEVDVDEVLKSTLWRNAFEKEAKSHWSKYYSKKCKPK